MDSERAVGVPDGATGLNGNYDIFVDGTDSGFNLIDPGAAGVPPEMPPAGTVYTIW